MIRAIFTTFALLLLAGCVSTVDVGPTETRSETVELGDASEVDAVIEMGAGELSVSGGADALMDADFTYNVPKWAPAVSYEVSGDRGELRVRQPEVEEIGWNDDIEYAWDLRFNDRAPLDMTVRLGAGENELALGALNLDNLEVEGGAGALRLGLRGSSVRDLDISLGAGEVRLDLGGDWDHDVNGRIQGGIGEVTIVLPNSVNVRAQVEGGLGQVNAVGLSRSGNSYTYDVAAAHTITLDITGGVGEINLRIEE